MCVWKAPTIDSPSIGNESNVIEFIHEILKGVIDNIKEFGFDEPLHNPI